MMNSWESSRTGRGWGQARDQLYRQMTLPDHRGKNSSSLLSDLR